MKIWFLILILSTDNPEQQQVVYIEQPDEITCLRTLDRFIYTETEDGDERTVIDKTCKEGDAS